MEALSDLKNALREIEEEDIAARVAERKSSTASARCGEFSATPFMAPTTTDSSSASISFSVGGHSAMPNRRRFLATAVAALVGIGFGTLGSAMWMGRAAAPAAPKPLPAAMSQYFLTLDRTFQTSGINAIQTICNSGNTEDALRVLIWIEQRKNPATFQFLVSTMSDPRPLVRAHAINYGLLLPAAKLKPYLPTLQATLLAETDPTLGSVLAKLVANVLAA